jgi:hypothetical protein
MTLRLHGDLAQAIGNTPLLKLRRASEATGCTILGKCEFMNPGQSVKDRAALYIIRMRWRGRLAPGRHHCRGHGRQHRHRAGAGGRLDGVQDGHRDPRDAEPGKEGHDPAGRGRTGAGARGALPQPQQLCALFRPAGRGAGPDRAERRDLGQPVRQYREPAGPCRNHRPRDLGPDRRQGGRLRLRGWFGRHLGGRRHGAAAQGREDRPGRPRGRGAAQPSTPPASWMRRGRRSPRASGRAGSPPTSKAWSPISAGASPMPRRCR